MTQFETLTKAMNSLEMIIAKEQAYILKCGAANDKDSDSQWEQYKADAEMHLKAWDEMKAKRDAIKAEMFKQAA